MSKRTDPPKPIDPSLLPVPSLPLGEALDALHTAGVLTKERHALLRGAVLPGVWTYGDLLTVLERGDLIGVPEVDAVLVERLKQVLGVESGA